MRLSLKAKQVVGVTIIVGLSMVVVNALYLARIARISLEQSQSRGELLARTMYQAATESVRLEDPAASLAASRSVRVLAEAGMAFSENVTYVAITDTDGRALVHSSPSVEGEVVPQAEPLTRVIADGTWAQLRAIYSDRTFEVRETLLTGGTAGERREFGAIRVGLSMLLVRASLREAMEPMIWTLLVAMLAALGVATTFAQWILRPIHVLRSGLSRLGRGEFGVTLDLPNDEEFADLGKSFNSLSAELASARSSMSDHPARLESVVDRLEDAVAIVSTTGEVMFANRGMRDLLGELASGTPLPPNHPLRPPLDRALAKRASEGPVSVSLPTAGAHADFLITVHPISDRRGRFIGAMLMARNVAYLTQVQSTIRYSRKVAALGRLLAGVAHEVKNPLNAMTIHLELLKQKLSGGGPRRATAEPDGTLATAETVRVDVPGVMKHAGVIADEIKRLDNVVQGFLKFSRPEELALAPVQLRAVCEDVARVVEPEAHEYRIQVKNACSPDVPAVYADRAMLRQAVLNLALNAVQSMKGGGVLTFETRRLPARMVQLSVIDTGEGIPPDHLARIFDLYFTTKQDGSGIGLSMVYRTVHLHDGTIEVESTPGHGTTFKVALPEA